MQQLPGGGPGPAEKVSAQADARAAEVGAIVREASLGPAAVDALHSIAQQMLNSDRVDLLAHALRRIFDAVPAAKRVTVVEWPPQPDGKCRPLLPDGVLRHEGLPPTHVSTSMARHAVDTRHALFFSSASPAHAALRSAPSVSLHRIQSAVYVPLIGADDRVLGLLCVDTPRPDAPLQAADFHFIRAVGALLTAALHADHMREEARRREMEAREVTVRRDAMANSLRIAAHDLRSPLTVIALAAQALDRVADPAMRRELMGDVNLAAQRARQLIETYLEAAAAEATPAAAPTARRVDVNARAMVDEEIHFLQASRAGHPAIPIVNAVACRSIPADPDRLRQVIGNLLSNAVKYSPSGGEVRVESEEDAAGATFRVIDHGVGIPAEDLPRLFEPFGRLPGTAATEGTGLGLWLTRGLLEAHGGRIWVESTPGKGSTFSFWLPRPSL